MDAPQGGFSIRPLLLVLAVVFASIAAVRLGNAQDGSGYETNRPQDLAAKALADSGRLQEAQALLLRSLAADKARLGPDHPNTIDTAENLGVVNGMLGQLLDALPLDQYVLASRLRHFGPDHEATLRAQTNLGQTLRDLGRPEEGARLLDEAASRSRSLYGPGDQRTLSRANNLAVALAEAGNIPEADAILKDVVATGEGSLGRDSVDVATWKISRARLLDLQGRFAESEALHRETIEALTRSLGADDWRVSGEQTNYAGTLMDQGRLLEAEPLLRAAIKAREATLGPVSHHTMSSRMLLGNLLSRLDRGDEALELRARNYELLRDQRGETDPDTLNAMGQYGNALAEVGRLDEAHAVLERKFDLSVRLYGPRHGVTYEAAFDLSGVLQAQNRTDVALALVAPAYSALTDGLGPTSPFTVEAAIRLAELLRDVGQRQEAIDLLGRSISALAPEGQQRLQLQLKQIRTLAELMIENGSATEVARWLTGLVPVADDAYGRQSPAPAELRTLLSAARLDSGDPEGALTIGREAYRDLRDRLAHSGALTPGEQTVARNRASAAAWAFVQAAWQVSRVAPAAERQALAAEAFEAAQVIGMGASAFAVARGLVRRSADTQGLGPLLKDWDRANHDVLAYDSVLSSADAGRGRLAITAATTRADLSARAETAAARLKAAFPDFFSLLNPEALAISALVSGTTPMLEEDQALILFLPGEGTDSRDQRPGFVWAMTRERQVWARLSENEAALADRITALRHQTDLGTAWSTSTRAPVNPEAQARTYPFDAAAAHALHDILLGDPEVANAIAGKDRWLLVPQGPLLSLPFGVLVTAEQQPYPTDAETLRHTAFLGAERSLTVLPALQSLGLRRALSSSRHASYLGFGDPAFSGRPAPLRSSEISLSGSAGVRNLPRLPGTRDEVESVLSHFPATDSAVFLGPDASEATLTRLDGTGRLARASVVHFATHGLLAGDLRGLTEPALALSPPEAIDAEPGDDGLLTASEAASLSLDADWVILSACNTASGDRNGAEGLSGLARAFLYAGARGLLVTHWEVRDDLAARMAIDIVSDQGTDRGTSLRRAVREIIADPSEDSGPLPLAHPANWAAFQIVAGDG